MCRGLASAYSHKPVAFCYFFGGIRLLPFMRLHRSQVLNYAVMFTVNLFWGGIRCAVVPKVSRIWKGGELLMLQLRIVEVF